MSTSVRNAGIKAVIWRNRSKKSDFYSVEIVRSFKDCDAWKNVNAFPNGDILIAARLLERANDALATLRSEHAEDEEGQ